MTDKRLTAEAVISQLADGMTIGIGGWGSRRKPMALVRAVLRSTLRDLTIVTFGGPDLGMLCAAGKVRRLQRGRPDRQAQIGICALNPGPKWTPKATD